jgi:hypothetical protein
LPCSPTIESILILPKNFAANLGPKSYLATILGLSQASLNKRDGIWFRPRIWIPTFT